MADVPARGPLCGPRCSARYTMVALASIGLGLIYGLKVGLHVTIVAMVNHTAVHGEEGTNKTDLPDHCHFKNASDAEPDKEGPFDWNNDVQGYLLSSYFFGYLVSQFPGGRVSEEVSAKWVYFFAVAINVVAVLLSPVMSRWNWGALLAMRILQGIGGGVTFPAAHVMLSRWAPPAERSVMSSLVYAGTSLGTVIFMLLSGIMATHLGWEAVFYIEGAIASIWLIVWVFLIQDFPSKQKYITPEERNIIVSSLEAESGGHEDKNPSVPWKSVLTSAPFWAILIAHTCGNWGWYMVLIELPQYMKQVLKFELSQNATLAALPFLTMWIFSIILSKVLDTLREKGKISTTAARKIATLIASVIPTGCFIALCFVECDRALAVTLMTVAVTTIGGMFSGFLSNHIDIAPHFAGTLMALTNTVATIPGILVPIAVGNLTHHDPSIGSWRIIFIITIVLYVIEMLVYTIFASGDVQPWN